MSTVRNYSLLDRIIIGYIEDLVSRYVENAIKVAIHPVRISSTTSSATPGPLPD